MMDRRIKNQRSTVVLLLVACVILQSVVAQVSLLETTVEAWIPCVPDATRNPLQSAYPLGCAQQQVFSRLRFQGSVSFDGQSFNQTVLDQFWVSVPPSSDPLADSLNPSGSIVPLPPNVRVRLDLLRPQIAYQMNPVASLAFGSILLQYTALANGSFFLQNPALLDQFNASQQCGGLANVKMANAGGCFNTLPPWLNSTYMVQSGVCGDQAYEPLMRRAIVGDMDFESLNAGSCGTAAMCFPCNSSEDATLQEEPVVYQTLNFGPKCQAYALTADPQLLIDVVAVVMVDGVQVNAINLPGFFDNQQPNVALSMLRNTMRLTTHFDYNEEQQQSRRLDGYVVVCPDPSVPSNLAPGVLGQGFNWVLGSPGWLPTFERLANTYPGLNNTNRSASGAWFYLTKDQYENLLTQGLQQPNSCGMNIISTQGVTAYDGAGQLYTNQAAMDLACVADTYDPLNITQPAPNTTDQWLGQVPPWQNACVPGQDPRFGPDPHVRTVCQVISRMQRYANAWDDATAGQRLQLVDPPNMPPGYDITQPNFLLAQSTARQFLDQAPPPMLVFTPPNMGRGITSSFDLTLDISTDLVPYLTPDSTLLVVNNAAMSGTMCSYPITEGMGYYGVEVCNLGLSRRVSVDIIVDQCPKGLRFQQLLAPAKKQGLSWSIASDMRSAAFRDILLLRPLGQNDAQCFATTLMTFSLNQYTVDQGVQQAYMAIGRCRVTLNATITSTQLDAQGNNLTLLVSPSIQQVCNTQRTELYVDDTPQPHNAASAWAWIFGGLVLFAVTMVFVVIIALLIAYAVKRGQPVPRPDAVTYGLTYGLTNTGM